MAATLPQMLPHALRLATCKPQRFEHFGAATKWLHTDLQTRDKELASVKWDRWQQRLCERRQRAAKGARNYVSTDGPCVRRNFHSRSAMCEQASRIDGRTLTGPNSIGTNTTTRRLQARLRLIGEAVPRTGPRQAKAINEATSASVSCSHDPRRRLPL